ncbi:hypothetical protein CW362_38640 [Streptomyces populi]|uniref:Uncharacterized protein n=1 Tax=Streptomyces populi TaxID=2058924 RepID=A0A2I0SCU5_9ACTN|nr:hypothetical protein CW362_38640 [Streptomyces populi]
MTRAGAPAGGTAGAGPGAAGAERPGGARAPVRRAPGSAGFAGRPGGAGERDVIPPLAAC